MRRNHRGSNRGVPAWQMQRQNGPRMTGGLAPLMSDQIGLQDIDKELELLKRKREIIEQQQQILSTDYRRNDYRDSYQNQNQNTRFDDYAQLYDDMRNFEPSRKRPIPVWEGEASSKRFSGGAPARLGSSYQGSAPRPSFRAHPSYKPKAKPQPRREPLSRPPAATRASKRSAAPPPPSAAPDAPLAPERKRARTGAGQPPSFELDEANRLVAGREPNKHVNGRLELALGGVIKDIRHKYETIVKAPIVMRRIKQTVRSRIRDVMTDKIVGQGPAVKAIYREVYDEDTDLEVVADALSHELKFVKLDTPKEYFKANMFVIMHMKLKSLLEKLETVALEEYTRDEPRESVDDIAAAETNPDDVTPAIKEEANTSVEESTEITHVKDEIVKESTETANEAEEINGSSDAKICKAEKKQLQLSDTVDENIVNTETYKALEMLMTKHMTMLLKKSAPQIIKLMDIDSKYTKLKSKVTADTVNMLIKTISPSKDLDQSDDVSMRSVKAQTPGKRIPIPYFVKLMGKPALPKRNLMQAFLDQFCPKSIKKHRAVHNLLFIGMMDKECFEKLLASDGTVIGKSTLSIRVSERTVPDGKPAVDTSAAADTATSADFNSSNTDDKLIGSELDDQITDLLSSIRQAEDETEVRNEADENADANVEAENADANVEAENADGGNADANAEGAYAEDIVNADEGGYADNQQDGEAYQNNGNVEEIEKTDHVTELAETKPAPAAKGTPVRASTRLAATPSRVQTRRTSRLAQNDA